MIYVISSPLYHKAFYYAVENKSVIKFFGNELFEVLNGYGSYVGVKLDNYFSITLNVDYNKIGFFLDFFVGDLFRTGSQRKNENNKRKRQTKYFFHNNDPFNILL